MKRATHTTTVRKLAASMTLAGVILIASGFATPVFAQAQFSSQSDHAIGLEQAVLYTTAFERAGDAGAVRAEAFGKEAILALLSQPGCAGLRIYFATGEDGRRVLVLVGVDVEGKDMYLGVLDEKGYPCPPLCDETSPLNGK